MTGYNVLPYQTSFANRSRHPTTLDPTAASNDIGEIKASRKQRKLSDTARPFRGIKRRNTHAHAHKTNKKSARAGWCLRTSLIALRYKCLQHYLAKRPGANYLLFFLSCVTSGPHVHKVKERQNENYARHTCVHKPASRAGVMATP